MENLSTSDMPFALTHGHAVVVGLPFSTWTLDPVGRPTKTETDEASGSTTGHNIAMPQDHSTQPRFHPESVQMHRPSDRSLTDVCHNVAGRTMRIALTNPERLLDCHVGCSGDVFDHSAIYSQTSNSEPAVTDFNLAVSLFMGIYAEARCKLTGLHEIEDCEQLDALVGCDFMPRPGLYVAVEFATSAPEYKHSAVVTDDLMILRILSSRTEIWRAQRIGNAMVRHEWQALSNFANTLCNERKIKRKQMAAWAAGRKSKPQSIGEP